MFYKQTYTTPKNFSNMIMTSDGEYLTGLYFVLSNDNKNQNNYIEKNLPIFDETRKWLDIYFSGKEPNFIPKLKINELTPFRKDVIEQIKLIKYGKTTTYNEIAKFIANKRNIPKMSCQAVGGAVGWNPICIIIPCHRVVGSNGNLTGFSGGMQNKIELLKLEQNNMDKFFIRKKGKKDE